ncbi:MAG TPA: glycoside hydrolase family 127 protein, partial [Verrucomicrobiota bacterium]|nr:glycoside hydrolase family 127 protein [Verrucomicrobiota bacterium]
MKMNIKLKLAVVSLVSASFLVQGDVTRRDDLQLKVQPVVTPKAVPFSLRDVHLLESPFKTAQDRAVKYLLSLEPDRFLGNFRKEAGLKPKA